MKYGQMNEIIEDQRSWNWKKVVARPFVLGFAFGIGCFVGSLILKSAIVSDLMETAKTIQLKKQ